MSPVSRGRKSKKQKRVQKSRQARIAEAEADREHGNSTVYRSEEEFLASLGDS